MSERILIGSATHVCKAYSFDRWLAAVRALTYPNLDVLVVDNSPTSENADRMRATGLTVIWQEGADQIHAMLRITRSMEVIRQYFLEGSWDRWFNLEADVIPPPDVIERLLELGHDADWISHSYPPHGCTIPNQQGVGCSIFSRKLAEGFDFSHAGDNAPDGWLWQQVLPQVHKYPTTELYGRFVVQHLDPPEVA